MPTDMSETEKRLGLPAEWIERRLEETDAGLSRRAIAELEETLAALSEEAQKRKLSQSLLISFTPQRLAQIAEQNELTPEDLVENVLADLSEGIAIAATSWTTSDGGKKYQVWGERWALVLRSQEAKDSGDRLAVLESIKPIDIPTRRLRLEMETVRFTAIWNEEECDPGRLLKAYDARKAQIQAKQSQWRELRERRRSLWEQRKACRRRIRYELAHSTSDSVVSQRRILHGMVRRHYSALRVMMELLRCRTENEQHQFQAKVLPYDAQTAESALGRQTEAPRLRLAIEGNVPAGVLEEDALVEILCESFSGRTRRARLIELVQDSGRLILQADLPYDLLSPGTAVTVRPVPRFSMWAHQRAVEDLLNEDVEGNWPNLVRLLCEPSALSAAASNQDIRFFNDHLNEQQRAAVKGALATPHAFLIQGPPGTGKTTVICEII